MYNNVTRIALDALEDAICKKYAWTGENTVHDVIEILHKHGKDNDITFIWSCHDEIVEKLNH